MKKILFAIAMMLSCASVPSFAQSDNMVDVFTSMPDTLSPLLSYNNRRDLTDFASNGMQARVRNTFGDYAELTKLTADYLHLDMSEKSSMEMKLLQTTDSVMVICVIHTVKAPAADSQIAFYNKDWQRLYWLEFPTPAISEFWADAPDSLADDAHYAQLSLADLRMVEITASADAPSFTLTLQTSELAEKEKDAAKQLVHPLQYLWTGTDFRKQ